MTEFLKDPYKQFAEVLAEDFKKFGKKDEEGNLLIDTGYSSQKVGEIHEEKQEKEKIVLPGEGRLISKFVEEIAPILKQTKKLFLRPELREIVEIGEIKDDDSEKKYLGFIGIKANRFITILEKHIIPGIQVWNKRKNEYDFIEKSINAGLSTTTLESPQLQDSLPVVERMFNFQMPILHNGELTFSRSGYDKRFSSYLPPNAAKISEPNMSLDEAKEILDEILKEFCFKSEQDKTNAAAGLLTPFLKGIFSKFNTRIPIFFYIANRERAGKDYLAGITQLIYLGYAIEEAPISTGEKRNGSNDELRKKITSALISGRSNLHFSNNKGFLDNAVLEGHATAEFWSDRLLGKNESVILPNELGITLSGNMGISYTPDFANRSRFIRLFLDIENANERKFENPDLHGWIKENREKILSALYALVRNWVNKGKPEGKVPFTSFPEWAKVCGGIMESAELGNPCVPDEETLSIGGDVETQEMKSLFEICYAEKPNEWVKKAEIISIIKDSDEDIFHYYDFDKTSDSTKFGIKLNKYAGRIFSSVRMVIKDQTAKGNRREFMFTSPKDVNLVNLITTTKPNQNDIIQSIQKGNKVYKVNNLELKSCDSCGELTSNFIKGIPICENCSVNVAEAFK